MARVPELQEFCARHNLKMLSVADLIRYRLKNERFIRRQAEGCIQTEFGDFRTIAYTSHTEEEARTQFEAVKRGRVPLWGEAGCRRDGRHQGDRASLMERPFNQRPLLLSCDASG